jgi:hypothetical protein
MYLLVKYFYLSIIFLRLYILISKSFAIAFAVHLKDGKNYDIHVTDIMKCSD